MMCMLVHLHKHTHEILPMRAWIAIWRRSAESYANWIDWLQLHDNGLPEIGWHDKRGQHNCVLDRMCLYAPIWKCELVAWQTRSARLRVRSDVSICTIEIGWHDRRGQHGCMLDQMCLYTPIRKCELLKLGGMTDEVSTVACWVEHVYMHHRDWVAW